MKNSLDVLNSRSEEEEEKNQQALVEIMLFQEKEGKKKKNEQSIRDQCNNIKHTNICTMGDPEREERREQKKYLNIEWPKTFQI